MKAVFTGKKNYFLSDLSKVLFSWDLSSKKLNPVEFPNKSQVRIKTISHRNYSHCLFATENNEVFGYGEGKLARKHFGNKSKKNFKRIDFFNNKKVKLVATGLLTSFVLLENGSLYAFGLNTVGQLGGKSNKTIEPTKPVKVKLGFLGKRGKLKDIKCGMNHTVFLSQSLNVYAAGEGKKGQLGLGRFKNKRNFTKVNKDSSIIQISCGNSFSIFLSSENRAFSTGNNKFGQLGINSTTLQASPQLISLQNIKKIECGSESSHFITKNNDIYGCGKNLFFNLGLKHNKEKVLVPSLLVWDIQFINVYGGNNCTFFETKEGTIYSLGSNKNGQCAVNKTHPIESPEFVMSKNISENERELKNNKKRKIESTEVSVDFPKAIKKRKLGIEMVENEFPEEPYRG